MKAWLAGVIALIGAGVAAAQTLPLGAPIMPQTKAAPAGTPVISSRIAPAAPLGANNLPANIQPQSAMIARVPSALPSQRQALPGYIADPTLATAVPDPKKKIAPEQAGVLRDLAPKAPERTRMAKANAPAPR